MSSTTRTVVLKDRAAACYGEMAKILPTREEREAADRIEVTITIHKRSPGERLREMHHKHLDAAFSTDYYHRTGGPWDRLAAERREAWEATAKAVGFT